MDDKVKTLHWHKDVCVNPLCRCGKSSVAVLLGWLTVEVGDNFVNYARWQAGGKNEKSKTAVAGEISSELAAHGFRRTEKSVKAKIEELETKFRTVVNKYGQPGGGIDDEADANDIRKLCPHYYQIKSVFTRRPSPRPLNVDETPEPMESSSTLICDERDDDGSSVDEASNGSNKGDAGDAGEQEPEEPQDAEVNAALPMRPRSLAPLRSYGAPPRFILALPAANKGSSEAPGSSAKTIQALDSAPQQPTKKRTFANMTASSLRKPNDKAELDYKKAELEVKKAELDLKKAELDYKKAELEVKKAELKLEESEDMSEFDVKKNERRLKERAQRRAELIQEATLMHTMGFSKEEVMDYIRQNEQ